MVEENVKNVMNDDVAAVKAGVLIGIAICAVLILGLLYLCADPSFPPPRGGSLPWAP